MDEEPDLWVSHLARLWDLQQAGCRFSLNDLTPQEWRGLIVFTREIQRRQAQAKKPEPEKK